MLYTYKFVTGDETIEVDEETYAILKDADRLERNSSIKYRKSTNSIDAYGFEPSFMGVEDEKFKNDPTKSPAYEYAMSHLTPRYQAIMIHRLIHGKKWQEVADACNSTMHAVWHSFEKAKKLFLQHYEEGVWLFSAENVTRPANDRIHYIPPGLNIEQIEKIREYRSQGLSQYKIADIMGLPRNQVMSCLRKNPILEFKCLYCGKMVPQNGRGELQKYCSRQCYQRWYRKEYSLQTEQPVQGKHALMNRQQRIAADYYLQIHIPRIQIAKIMDIPHSYIVAHATGFPLPYTECVTCGKKIPGNGGQPQSKYCSRQCKNRHDHLSSKARKLNIPNIVTPEQLYYAVELRDDCYTYDQICRLTDIPEEKLPIVFRFHKEVNRTCLFCKKPFTTTSVHQLHCSEECRNQEKEKRRVKRLNAKRRKRENEKKTR